MDLFKTIHWQAASSFSSLLLNPSPFLHDRRQAFHNLCHPAVIQGLRKVCRRMIVRIAIEGRVCDHERLVSELAEGPVIRKVDAENDCGSVQRNDWKIDSLHEILRGRFSKMF